MVGCHSVIKMRAYCAYFRPVFWVDCCDPLHVPRALERPEVPSDISHSDVHSNEWMTEYQSAVIITT